MCDLFGRSNQDYSNQYQCFIIMALFFLNRHHGKIDCCFSRQITIVAKNEYFTCYYTK